MRVGPQEPLSGRLLEGRGGGGQRDDLTPACWPDGRFFLVFEAGLSRLDWRHGGRAAITLAQPAGTARAGRAGILVLWQNHPTMRAMLLRSQAPIGTSPLELADGKHHLLLEANGYRWYRVGGLDYLLKRSEIETPSRG
jgi:hypothetical protein